jgi:hypothetical protein
MKYMMKKKMRYRSKNRKWRLCENEYDKKRKRKCYVTKEFRDEKHKLENMDEKVKFRKKTPLELTIW